MNITDRAALRSLYAPPKERALRKQLDRLDRHCKRFIEMSPFVVLASAGAGGALDASPRGGEPGFVRVLDERTLLIPDAPGNNRLDTLENLLERPELGLLFMVPGVEETLRVNGQARLTTHSDRLDCFSNDRRRPLLVIELAVREAYLHCAKSLMRSKLWDSDSRVPRDRLASTAEMLRDHTGMDVAPETQDEMRARYAGDL